MVFNRARFPTAARMFSTVVGHSGRVYTRQKVLQHHPSKPAFDIHLALCDHKPFVVKPVSPSIFELLKEFKDEFNHNPRLRIYVDYNKSENILVYEYFKSDLLTLVENYPALSIEARKTILKEVGLGLSDIHTKDWIHLDLKPNNVFLDWYVDKNDQFQLEKVTLGDMDCALKLEDQKLLNQRMGNVMWRSPEGQLGKGVGKPSEVFSFGLLCLYVITGVQCFHPNFDELETEPEPVILFKLLSAFGPLPDALVKHVNDEEAESLLRGLWQAIAEDESNETFEQWSEETFPNLNDEAKSLILRMTHLDPAKRARMSDIMMDCYWN
ncbi:putative serine/threonine protein kinase [Glonium stellatum]|uniref:Putative serine/threonine protein kinase n=1 Tax=Glonium stellatum TaxID=574774 RepID=A0A8E2F5V1_9PEZI|nr:putative serine/threonine protein kinase [Glonium stellatum]